MPEERIQGGMGSYFAQCQDYNFVRTGPFQYYTIFKLAKKNIFRPLNVWKIQIEEKEW